MAAGSVKKKCLSLLLSVSPRMVYSICLSKSIDALIHFIFLFSATTVARVVANKLSYPETKSVVFILCCVTTFDLNITENNQRQETLSAKLCLDMTHMPYGGVLVIKAVDCGIVISEFELL